MILEGVTWIPAENEPDPNRPELPFATHSGVLHIFGTDIRCYRLSDGKAVFDADDFEQLLIEIGMATES